MNETETLQNHLQIGLGEQTQTVDMICLWDFVKGKFVPELFSYFARINTEKTAFGFPIKWRVQVRR